MSTRQAGLVMLSLSLYLLLLLPVDGDLFSERDMAEKTVCSTLHHGGDSGKTTTAVGDIVKIRLKTSAADMFSTYNDHGESVQERVKVGQHNVTPLNKCLMGMSVGETRRASIPLTQGFDITYTVTLLSVESKAKGHETEL
ncbi:unnamed protein product [Vitrella brassicaformis CCMP3155]|uniref:Peptidylprolyl isomerase n=1 Tax=Vitrella brassicaformis (strain CCMP3155) TaxID=1169540 RepID=A0A0G4G7U7_VITBC|nr:unnamed protein product [Vitrella brassicaformis CCMP3155]|eukprot:CEM24486.1 unnamed protein product [Vitrella brassicaformis CCMP3155]